MLKKPDSHNVHGAKRDLEFRCNLLISRDYGKSLRASVKLRGGMKRENSESVPTPSLIELLTRFNIKVADTNPVK